MTEAITYPTCERLAAQWGLFFARTRRNYQFRPQSFTLPSGQCYTPDFYVSNIGWVSVSEEPSIYEAHECLDGVIDSERVCVRKSFALFFEFASNSKEWCYWLGGAIPFYSLTEVGEQRGYGTLEELGNADWLHRAERLREEWPASYQWYKLRQHSGPRRLPPTADQCGGLLAKLRGANFKTSILDSEAYSAFDHKAALIAARSAYL